MLTGLTHLIDATLKWAVVHPRRLRAYQQRTATFIHRTPDGLRFELQPNEEVDRYIAVDGIYERHFLGYLRSILKPDAVMLDVGANIGNHTIYLAGRCREIHCFEPNPHVAARLRRNIALNGLTLKATVHEFGLGAADETLPFVENLHGNLGASRFAASGVPAAGNVMQLQVRDAGKAIEELNLDRIDYIKIDIEGMEDAVLGALAPILSRYLPMVTFEHHEHLAPAGTFDRIKAALAGYRLMDLRFEPIGSRAEKVLWYLRHNGGPVLTELRKPEQRSYFNILAVPPSQ